MTKNFAQFEQFEQKQAPKFQWGAISRVAKEMGISQSYVSAVMAGKTAASAETLAKITKKLNTASAAIVAEKLAKMEEKQKLIAEIKKQKHEKKATIVTTDTTAD